MQKKVPRVTPMEHTSEDACALSAAAGGGRDVAWKTPREAAPLLLVREQDFELHIELPTSKLQLEQLHEEVILSKHDARQALLKSGFLGGNGIGAQVSCGVGGTILLACSFLTFGRFRELPVKVYTYFSCFGSILAFFFGGWFLAWRAYYLRTGESEKDYSCMCKAAMWAAVPYGFNIFINLLFFILYGCNDGINIDEEQRKEVFGDTGLCVAERIITMVYCIPEPFLLYRFGHLLKEERREDAMRAFFGPTGFAAYASFHLGIFNNFRSKFIFGTYDYFSFFLGLLIFSVPVRNHLLSRKIVIEAKAMLDKQGFVSVKSPGRAMEKLHRNYNGDCRRIVDLVRNLIVCDSAEQIVAVVAKIVSTPNVAIVRVKNRLSPTFDVSQTGGWRNVAFNMLIVDNYTRAEGLDTHIVELQIELRSFHTLRLSGHVDYEDARKRMAT